MHIALPQGAGPMGKRAWLRPPPTWTAQRPFESLVETYRAIAAGMMPPGTHRFFAASGIARTIEARFRPGRHRAAGGHRRSEGRSSPVAGFPKPGRSLLHRGGGRVWRRGSGGSAGGASGEHPDVPRHVGCAVSGISATAPTRSGSSQGAMRRCGYARRCRSRRCWATTGWWCSSTRPRQPCGVIGRGPPSAGASRGISHISARSSTTWRRARFAVAPSTTR